MYCEKCKGGVHCQAIIESNCEICEEYFLSFNAPPVNKLCPDCAKLLNRCELCGEELNPDPCPECAETPCVIDLGLGCVPKLKSLGMWLDL